MTVAPAPPTEDLLGLRVAQLHGMIDELQRDADDPEASAGQPLAGRTLAEVDRAIRRLQSVKLSLLVAADHSGLAAAGGYADTTAWAARTTHCDSAATREDLRLATELHQTPPAGKPDAGASVTPLPSLGRRSATADALASGAISPEHASVVMRALRELPAALSPDQRLSVEDSLVTRAQRVSPSQLRRLARRALAAAEDDAAVVDAHEDARLRDEEAAALDRASLTLHDHGDGTTSGHFLVPTVQAGILRKAIDAMTAPRRRGGRSVSADRLPVADWRHRRGLALVELLEHLPTDRLATRTAATVVVTTTLQSLRGGLAAAHLDTGEALSAGATRRLACGAGVLPAVLDGASVPIDLGRERRLFSESQRAVLATRHDECAADGCDRPFAWCELHHRDPWSRGGFTDVANAVPLCAHHHRRIHDPGYLHRRLPDGSIRFSRRT